MGRLIVTSSVVSETPFYMKKSGHPLYSYEELCYYIRTRMGLWMEEMTREGLTEKMQEWNVPVKDLDFLSPLEAAERIMEAGTYFGTDEKEQMFQYMQEYDQIEERFREKEKGDLYFDYGKSRGAYLAYWKAVSALQGDEDKDFRASLYHNMAVICCRFFYWKEAKNWFALALNEKDTEESRIGLELVIDMEKKGWSMDGKPADPEKLHRHEETFLAELE